MSATLLRTRVISLGLLLAGAAVACGSTSTTGNNATNTPNGGGGTPGSATSGAPVATGSAGSANIAFSGAVAGQLVGSAMDLSQSQGESAACGKQSASGTWDGDFIGPVNGGQASVRITDANYSGPGTFTSDANVGDVQVKVSGGGHNWINNQSNGGSEKWTMTINADEKSGKIHSDLHDPAAGGASGPITETIDGTFSC
jgi:hypothetical protein